MQTSAPTRSTTTITGIDVITLTEIVGHRNRDLVEIEPVRLDGDQAVPVHGNRARAHSSIDVNNAGELELTPNPHFVRGAYADLRSHQVCAPLEALGLNAAPGNTHLVPIAGVGMIGMLTDIETDAKGGITHGHEGIALARPLCEAASAAKGTEATHVAIRIS